jgi:hypothetical protein
MSCRSLGNDGFLLLVLPAMLMLSSCDLSSYVRIRPSAGGDSRELSAKQTGPNQVRVRPPRVDGQFALLSPQGIINDISPKATWQKMANAKKYKVKASKDKSCDSKGEGWAEVFSEEWAVPEITDSHERYLCVKALTDSGRERKAQNQALPFRLREGLILVSNAIPEFYGRKGLTAANGDVFVLGLRDNCVSPTSDIDSALYKYSHGTFSPAWLKCFDRPSSSDMTIAADGNLLVVGQSKGNSRTPLMMKISPDGDQIWDRNFTDIKGGFLSVIKGGDDLYTFGYQSGFGTGKDFLISKHLKSGEINWQQSFDGNAGDDYCVTGIISSNRFLLVACYGQNLKFPGSGYDATVFKLTLEGEILEEWRHEIDSLVNNLESQNVAQITELVGGDFMLFGQSFLKPVTRQSWRLTLSANGEALDYVSFDLAVVQALPTKDGAMIAVGYRLNDSGSPFAWSGKISSQGQLAAFAQVSDPANIYSVALHVDPLASGNFRVLERGCLEPGNPKSCTTYLNSHSGVGHQPFEP